MGELTRQGYDMILDAIRSLEVPCNWRYNTMEMEIWVRGWSDCMQNVMMLIENLRDENGR